MSVAVFGISRSRTAPVFLPFKELLISFKDSAAGVMAADGVVAVPAFVSAALTPRAVKLVSTDLMSPKDFLNSTSHQLIIAGSAGWLNGELLSQLRLSKFGPDINFIEGESDSFIVELY
jgi:hypothetical protein